MKTIIAIIGRSGSGKDTIKNYLKDKYNYKEVISFSTRPIRENEVNGREHYFISKDEMTKLLDNNKLIAYLDMTNPNDEPRSGYEYGCTIDELLNSNLYIIDPSGLEELKQNIKNNNLDIDVKSIYIYADANVRKNRIVNSNRFSNIASSEQEYINRENNENHLFNSFESEQLYDYCINNSDTLNNALEQVDIIMKNL